MDRKYKVIRVEDKVGSKNMIDEVKEFHHHCQEIMPSILQSNPLA
jgi:hypothetical protein